MTSMNPSVWCAAPRTCVCVCVCVMCCAVLYAVTRYTDPEFIEKQRNRNSKKKNRFVTRKLIGPGRRRSIAQSVTGRIRKPGGIPRARKRARINLSSERFDRSRRGAVEVSTTIYASPWRIYRASEFQNRPRRET